MEAWLAEDNALASFMAFLYWQELMLTYWVGDLAPVPYYQQAVADDIALIIPGLVIPFSQGDLLCMKTKQTRRVTDKDRWQDPGFRAAKNKTRNVRKGKCKAKAGAVVGYVGNGTAEGFLAAVQAAAAIAPSAGLFEYYTSGVTVGDLDITDMAVTEADREAGDIDRGEADSASGEEM